MHLLKKASIIRKNTRVIIDRKSEIAYNRVTEVIAMHKAEFVDWMFLQAALKKDPKYFEDEFGPMNEYEKKRFANLMEWIEEQHKTNPGVTFSIPNSY